MKRLDVALPRSWDTAAGALAACARALGDPRSPSELHTASGLAARISIDRRVTPAGPHGYPWREELTLAAERLGYRWQLVASRAGEPLAASLRDHAFALARDGIEQGRPTLLFGVHVAEFGLAVGHDGDALVVSGVLDGAAPALLTRAALGGDTGLLFALQLVERVPVDAATAARAMLRAALEHQHGPVASDEFFAGAAAWQAIAFALDSGAVDPTGLSYAAQRYAEARLAFSQHLPAAAATLRLDGDPVDRMTRPARRAAAMLAELAQLLPFPPPPEAMLTTTRREQAAELCAEAARAEAEAIAAIGEALALCDQRAAVRDLRVVRLDEQTLPALYTCAGEIPIAGLDAESATCRERYGASRARGFDGRLLLRGERAIGHILWAPLDEARYPVAGQGRRWFVFCPWLERTARGRGIGAALFQALDQAGRDAGVDGFLTFATSMEVFLHHHGYEKYGFAEVDRRGDTRLLERRLTALPSAARILDPPQPPASPRRGALPVVIRHAWNCPLLLRVRTEAARAARTLGPQVIVDEADATASDPSGIAVDGKAVAHGPIPPEAVRAALQAELADLT